MRKIAPLGGLAVLALHSQIAGAPERVGVIGEVIDSARAEGSVAWWLASGSEVAQWWLARDGSRLQVKPAEPEGIQVEVTATSSLGSAWVEVYDERARTTLVPFDGETPLPYARTEWGVRFPLPDLAVGESRLLFLRPQTAETESAE
jgi:hypothetical protein